MALNSYITKDGKEMGRAQVVQAEAAGLDPDVNMNPILLKPSTMNKIQIIVCGKSIGNMSGIEYNKFKKDLKLSHNLNFFSCSLHKNLYSFLPSPKIFYLF